MKIGVVGLGEVGLRMALYYGQRGHPVTGVDVSRARLRDILRAEIPRGRAARALLRRLLRDGRLHVSDDYAALADAEVVTLCVPSRLTRRGTPDLSAVEAAALELSRHLRPGQLVILESSVPPGTTRGPVQAGLGRSGLRAGSDYFLACSPHRLDPGRPLSPARIPRLVAGCTGACLERALEFLRSTGQRPVPVSSPEAAEAAKLYENAFRLVNVSLANEFASYCVRAGLDPGEVIAAAATKPFGFMPFWPGPGAGGTCIPVTPAFLLAHAQEHGAGLHLLAAALRANRTRPAQVAEEVAAALAAAGRSVRRSLVFVLGVTYKPGATDLRGSPVPAVMARLLRLGARLAYHDPFVPCLRLAGRVLRARPPAECLAEADCLLIATDHPCYDLPTLAREVTSRGGVVVDPRASLSRVAARRSGPGGQAARGGARP